MRSSLSTQNTQTFNLVSAKKFALTLSTLALSVIPINSHAATVNVTTTDNLAQIMLDAAPGDILSLASGTYTAQATTYSTTLVFRLLKNLTIKSSSGNPADVVLQGAAGQDYVVQIHPGTYLSQSITNQVPNGATLQNISIQGGKVPLFIQDYQNLTGRLVQNITIDNLRISSTACVAPNCSGNEGIQLFDTQGVKINNTTISAGSNGINMYGIYGLSKNNYITNNTFNNITTGMGITVRASSRNVISGNTINTTGFEGIFVDLDPNSTPKRTSVENTISFNTINNQKVDGIALDRGSSRNALWMNNITRTNRLGPNPTDHGVSIWLNCNSSGNRVIGNSMSGAAEVGIDIRMSSSNWLEGNTVFDNLMGGILVTGEDFDCATTKNYASTKPQDTLLEGNHIYFTHTTGHTILRDSKTSIVQLNYLSGRDPAGNTPPNFTWTSGLDADKGTAQNKFHYNTIRDNPRGIYLYGTNVPANFSRTGTTDIVKNRFLNNGGVAGSTYGMFTISPTVVAFGSNGVIGGNHYAGWSTTGNPNQNTQPFTSFSDSTQNSPYLDAFPYASDQLRDTANAAPTPAVLTPIAGANIAPGASRLITWLAPWCTKVDLAYVSSNTTTTIQAGVVNTGKYVWAVPTTLAGQNTQISVTCKDSAGVSVGSAGTSANFSVAAVGGPKLLAPIDGNIVTTADGLLIAWKGVSNGVDVQYSDNSGAWVTIATGVQGNAYTAAASAFGTAALNNVKIRVRKSSSTIADDLDGVVIVPASSGGAVTFTKPAASATLNAGEMAQITWNTSINAPYVDVEWSTSPGVFTTIAANQPNLGRFNWLVENTPSTSAQLRLTPRDANFATTGSPVTLAVTIAAPVVAAPLISGVLKDRYRLYLPAAAYHLYTTDVNEYGIIPNFGWQQEGPKHRVWVASTGSYANVSVSPYYRLNNRTTGEHHWTTDANEYNILPVVSNGGWVQEGIDGYIIPPNANAALMTGAVALHRLYQPGLGRHLWTTDNNEKNVLTTSAGWVYEGLAGYVVPMP